MSYPLEKYRYYTDGVKRVIAVSTYAGKVCRGVAVCHPNDTFDLELGKRIAAAKCNAVVAFKRYMRAQDKSWEVQRNLREAQEQALKEKAYYDDVAAAYDEAINELNALQDEIKSGN